MKITILDYGMANLRSVQKAFEAVGAKAIITSDVSDLPGADRIVLPGVGAFRDAIARIRETGLGDAVLDHIRKGRPFLGICLGMQMLFERGYEDGIHDGLNYFGGDVVRFTKVPGLKIPHMGWNTLDLARTDCPLFKDLPASSAFYFVHSYHANPSDPTIVAGTANYPTPFCAAIWKDNVFATQFHPEKSQAAGRVLLKNFAKL